MPTLDWIGKEAVVSHAATVPTRLLHCEKTLSVGSPDSPNLLVEGDNLAALKALLPFYAGSVKCIYIDPPYNTGNEGWIYNDNVRAPEIARWLGATVGKEAEDLSRHDKWLCMMYPRLVLLRQMLREDGAIFISIDDNEIQYLRLLCDEIFGARNFVAELIWKKSYGGGSKSNYIVGLHEYILCYARNKENIPIIELPPDANARKYYTVRDEKYDTRGPFRTQPLATNSMDERPNLRYPILHNGEEIWPEKQWQWSQERVTMALANNDLLISKQRGKYSVRYKQYLYGEDGSERSAKPYSIIDGPYTQEGTQEVRDLLGDGKAFSFPKPTRLIKYLLSFFCQDKDSLILDSFIGSGTTGQAVLSLNAEDGGTRRFIGIEMESDIARPVTRERLKRVIEGVGSTPALGGGFRFCTLGEPLLSPQGQLQPDMNFWDVAHFLFFSETGRPLPQKLRGHGPFIGACENVGYFLWPSEALDAPRLAETKSHKGPRVLWAPSCRLSRAKLEKANAVFKQLPYEMRLR